MLQYFWLVIIMLQYFWLVIIIAQSWDIKKRRGELAGVCR